MPHSRSHSLARVVHSIWAWMVLVAWVSPGFGQTPPMPPAKNVRLPDGTMIVIAKNPTDGVGPADGVIVSAKDYQQLLEQAEAGKRNAAPQKPIAPTSCLIRGRAESRKDRSVGLLQISIAYRTTTPRSLVLLGLQRAFPTSAKLDTGALPILELTPEGLAVAVEKPGSYTLTLDVEVPIGPRAGKNEIGWELGLPRAAITMLAFDSPAPEVKQFLIGTRGTDATRPTELKRTAEAVSRFTTASGAKGQPLGPVELLEVAWEVPTATAPPSGVSLASTDATITVRIDELQMETTATIRLSGAERNWIFPLPRDALVNLSRIGAKPEDTDTGPKPLIVAPAEGKPSDWKVTLPESPAEWVATVVLRQPRPAATDSKYAGPYRVNPFHSPTAVRQTGLIRVFAPLGIRLTNFKLSPQLRRQDAPPSVEETPVAVFRYAKLSTEPTINLEFEARPARGTITAQPHHQLTLAVGGWQLRSEVRIVPIRTLVDQLTIELPAGWLDPIIQPLELVDEVQGSKEPAAKRTLNVRLATSQKEPFTLIFESRYPLPATALDASLLLPRFSTTAERDSQLTVSVPEPFDLRGNAYEWEGSAPGTVPIELKSPTARTTPAARQILNGRTDGSFSRVSLSWQTFRPELGAEVRAEVTLTDRQAIVQQTIRFKTAEPLTRPIRLKGPLSSAAFRAVPSVEPLGPGEWSFLPPGGVKDATLTLSYALPLPSFKTGPNPPPQSVPIPLVWPEATRVDSSVRVWGGSGLASRKLTRFEGPWRELPPAATPERDAFPWLSLSGTGANLPLNLELSEAPEVGGASVIVDRAVLQSWSADDGSVQLRARFVVKRWPAYLDCELATLGTPSVRVDQSLVTNLTLISRTDDGTERRTYRIPLPEAKANRVPILIDVRATAPPPQSRTEWMLQPVIVRDAVYRKPIWWQIVAPPTQTPLFLGEGNAEFRWGWRGALYSPVSPVNQVEFDRWLADATDPDAEPETSDTFTDPGGEGLTLRQLVPARVTLVRLPRGLFVVGCSLIVVLFGVGVSRVRPVLVGPMVLLFGVLLAVLAILFPQPTAQAVSSGLWGVVVVAVAFAVQALLAWYTRRRVTHLSAFARNSSSPMLPPVLGPRPSRPSVPQGGSNGSAGQVPSASSAPAG